MIVPPLRCAITARSAYHPGEGRRTDALLAQAAGLAAAGVDYLQLREKDLPAGDLVRLARALLRQLHGSRTRLLINSRVDVALAVPAPGVHLTSAPGQLTPAQVYTLYAAVSLPAPLVTLSCHTLEEVKRHCHDPIAAILFGPVFEKPLADTHALSGSGLELLRQACLAAAAIPVLALGGVTLHNIAACLQAGAAGVAGIRLFQQG